MDVASQFPEKLSDAHGAITKRDLVTKQRPRRSGASRPAAEAPGGMCGAYPSRRAQGRTVPAGVGRDLHRWGHASREAGRKARTLIFDQHEMATFIAGAKNGDFGHLRD